jgi:hypothetical protein
VTLMFPVRKIDAAEACELFPDKPERLESALSRLSESMRNFSGKPDFVWFNDRRVLRIRTNFCGEVGLALLVLIAAPGYCSNG